MTASPIKVFITGAANGLAEVREGLADHPEVELVGTAADPTKVGSKLAESGAQVVLHGTTATDHVPTDEIDAIRGITAAPIVLVTSASANAILSQALSRGHLRRRAAAAADGRHRVHDQEGALAGCGPPDGPELEGEPPASRARR